MSGKQDYETPPELFAACEKRFGRHAIDLAATAENSQCPVHLGPGAMLGMTDALAVDWALAFELADDGTRGWLNPPFANMEPWIAKCIEAARGGLTITLACLPSLETAWARDAIKWADVYHLWPRVPFVDTNSGKRSGNPRNTMILDFNGSDRRRSPCLLNWQTNKTTEFAP